MGVEDVAGIGLAARRTAHQQRQLPVRRGLLGQVVVDAERIAALLVHEVLGHRRAGVRSVVLQRRRVRRRRDDHDGVIHRARVRAGSRRRRPTFASICPQAT